MYGSTPFEMTCEDSGSLKISDILNIIHILENNKYYR